MSMLLKIGSRLISEVDSYAEASEVYCREREASYEGASTFPGGTIFDGNVEVARISYNGKVWPPEPWAPGLEPIWPAKA